MTNAQKERLEKDVLAAADELERAVARQRQIEDAIGGRRKYDPEFTSARMAAAAAMQRLTAAVVAWRKGQPAPAEGNLGGLVEAATGLSPNKREGGASAQAAT